MNELVILGAGGSGVDIIDIVNAINQNIKKWNIIGFLDDNPNLKDKYISGYKVLGTIDEAYKYNKALFISSIANPTNRIIRRKIWDRVIKQECNFATLIHPSAVIYNNVLIKNGSVINALCVIGSNVVIEEDVHLAYSCNVAHETVIKAHSTLGTGVNLSSGITIGVDCYIGAGVSATHDIEVEDNTLVAVGSAITENLCNNNQRIWVGVPAISIKEFMRNKIKLRDI